MLSENDVLELRRLNNEGDIFVLLRLEKMLKNTASKKILLDIKELITYNYVVVDMECGYFEWTQALMDRYINLKEKLFERIGLQL